MSQNTISVIVPFKDRSKMTLTAVKSLLKYGPKLHEVLLVSNNSNGVELNAVKSFTKNTKIAKLLEYNKPFNYQKLNNWAVSKATGNTILFLNNDTELTKASIGLLEKMIRKAKQANVGIVGCTLLYGDSKTIQHAGVFLQPKGTADHLYVGKSYKKALRDGGSTIEFPYDITKDMPMTSVTGAVNVIEKSKFLKVGGFDEKFVMCGGDVDLCIRLNKKGFQTWFIGGGYIIHKESQSRTHKPIEYNDFYRSYIAYMRGYDSKVGDPFLPKITKDMK